MPPISGSIAWALSLGLMATAAAQSPRKPPPPKMPARVMQATSGFDAPTVTAINSLKGLKSLSIVVEGFGSDTPRIKNEIAAHLERDGITVLADGKYPQLYLYSEGSSAEFHVGYTTHSISGRYIALGIYLLLPFDNGAIEARTYMKHRFAAGLTTPSDTMLADVLYDFFTDWEKINPLVPQVAHPRQDGDLEAQDIFTIEPNSKELKSSVFWTHNLQVQYDTETRRIFKDSAYRSLVCRYQGNPHPSSTTFWFKQAPPESAEFNKLYPQSIFTKYGMEAIDACPANLALAAEAKKKIKGDAPCDYNTCRY